jgi:hypothetical protein
MSLLPLVALALPAQAAHGPAAPDAPVTEPPPERRELAGKPVALYPHFQFTRSVNQGDTVSVAFDTRSDPRATGRRLALYVIEHAELPAFRAGRELASVAAGAKVAELRPGGLRANVFTLDAGTLSGKSLPDGEGTLRLGRGYDVVVDVDGDGRLGAGDWIDGGDGEAGFYVVEAFAEPRPGSQATGPYPVSEVLFQGGLPFTLQDVYYPANVAALGALPLVVVSHGNGHDYRWYDHIGYHLASWGYVVMSHSNETGPGIETAASSTLQNTDLFLARLGDVAGGALAGHVDGRRIVWIGHSRGGEGVVRAWRRLAADPLEATRFTLADVRLVSSIAPTDFLGPSRSDMGSAPYHLWTGGADDDVNGCADCDICQTFHLLARADGPRYSTSLHGAGHGDFHDGGGDSVAFGNCKILRPRTHAIMRAILLPLLQHALDGNPACLDYLTRQYEEFRALGAPDPELFENRCVTVDLQYLPGPGPGRFVVDDFQSEPGLQRSSSLGSVLPSRGLASSVFEGRLDDGNGTFRHSTVDVMNGMTQGGPGDTTAGLVLAWDGRDEFVLFELVPAARDLRAWRTLSFRAARATRDPRTEAEAGDLDLTVQLTDSARRSSSIRIGAYGGGIEQPYPRTGCGAGKGWANEFETVRIPLADFTRDGRSVDLADVIAVGILVGPSHGTRSGRIGLDDLELLRE